MTASIARASLKLPGSCRGGKSRKLCSQLPTQAVAGAITPVPGGIGPMTIAMLLSNTARAAARAAGVGHDALLAE